MAMRVREWEGEKEMEWGGEGRGSVFTHLPVTTSHTRTVPSSDPAGRLPWLHSGQRAAASKYLTYIHNVPYMYVVLYLKPSTVQEAQCAHT